MGKIIHKVEDKLYQQLDLRDGIYLADSFVSVPQKLATGNGEAKLYVGNESSEVRHFFGIKPFAAKCFFKKNELIKFLEELRSEYKNPEQQYRRKEELPQLFDERLSKVKDQDDIIWFSINEQAQIQGPRIYVKSSDTGYKFLRELALPTLSYLSFIKLQSSEETIFHARLFTDFSPLGSRYHPTEDPNIIHTEVPDKFGRVKIRVGQSKFKKLVLESCPFCPVTNVSDDRLLDAAHIKPHARSQLDEMMDKFNGISLTPSIHRLYDLGFIGVNQNSKLLISEWISKVTAKNIGIQHNKSLNIPEFSKRSQYFEYHEQNIFK